MLDYTRAIMNKTRNDVDTAITVFRFGTQIIYIAYLIYLLITMSSIWYLHLALFVISVAFLIFDLVTTNVISELRDAKKTLFSGKSRRVKLYSAKQKRRTIKQIKFYVSHVLKLFVLAASLYPMIVSPDTVHPISIICITVMALTWIMLIVFEVFRMVLVGRMDIFIEAIHADMEIVSKPVNTVKNAFNKFIGREVEENPKPTKERRYLDKLVEDNKAENIEKRKAKRAERSEKIATWFDEHLPKRKKKAEDDEKENELVAAADSQEE